MHISTDSWHYKMVKDATWRAVPTNICPYMRRLFWIMLKTFVVWFVVSLVVLFVTVCLLAPIAYLIHAYAMPFIPLEWFETNDGNSHPFIAFLSMGVFAYAVMGIFSASYCIAEGTERYENSDRYRNRIALKNSVELQPKQRSVFYEWLKGIHNKTCTSLEFVDSKD